MRNFKQYLTEAIDFAPWQHPDSEEFKKLNFEYDIAINRNYFKINKDGTVSTNKSDYTAYYIEKNGGWVLPVKYKTAKDFDTIGSSTRGLTSLWGFPDVVKNHAAIDSKVLKTFDHLHTNANELYISTSRLKELGNCSINVNKLTIGSIGSVSFKDFAKCVTINEKLSLDWRAIVDKPILSLLKFKGNYSLTFYHQATIPEEDLKDLRLAFQILKKHGRDILSAQEELMDNGLEVYAQL